MSYNTLLAYKIVGNPTPVFGWGVVDATVTTQIAQAIATWDGAAGTITGIGKVSWAGVYSGVITNGGVPYDGTQTTGFYNGTLSSVNQTPAASTNLLRYPVPLGSPALGSTTALHAAVTLSGVTQNITMTTQPDTARQVVFTTSVNTIAGSGVLSGLAPDGATVISETITFPGSGSTTINSTRAYSHVNPFIMPAKTNASGDTIAMGTNAALGVGYALSRNTVIRELCFNNNVKEATAPTVATNGTDASKNLVTLVSTLAGTPVIIGLVA